MATRVEVAGTVKTGPASPIASSLEEFLRVDLRLDVGGSESGSLEIDGAFLLPLAAIRFAALQAVDGDQFQVTVTSALGAAVLPLSGTWWQAWPTGTAVDSISVQGTGRLEWLVAGG